MQINYFNKNYVLKYIWETNMPSQFENTNYENKTT